MDGKFVDITAENIATEHLCCIIRSKKPHPGVEAKRKWLTDCRSGGHVFRKLDEKVCVFIEYAPVENAWVPVVGENYLYIYCLWVNGEAKGHGYGSALMESCIADAKAQGKAGICMLGAKKQKAWLSDQRFAKRFGFETVDSTPSGYELLALSFDGTKPRFMESARQERIEEKELTIFYSDQCPYILQILPKLQAKCAENQVPLHIRKVDTIQQAKALPCVFNNWAAFYDGVFKTVDLVDYTTVEKWTKKKNG